MNVCWVWYLCRALVRESVIFDVKVTDVFYPWHQTVIIRYEEIIESWCMYLPHYRCTWRPMLNFFRIQLVLFIHSTYLVWSLFIALFLKIYFATSLFNHLSFLFISLFMRLFFVLFYCRVYLLLYSGLYLFSSSSMVPFICILYIFTLLIVHHFINSSNHFLISR